MSLRKIAALGAVLLVAGFANADVVSYGDFSGTDVMFLDVTENTNESGDAEDFGAPSVVGNTLDFDPIDFNTTAQSNGGFASSINDATLRFTMMSTDGNIIENTMIAEGGDWTIAGPNGLTSYGAAIVWEIVEVDGAPVSSIVSGSTSFGSTFTAAGGPNLWSDVAMIDFSSALADAGIVGGATKVEVILDNTLRAEADQGSTAFIAKKDAGVMVMVNIPEPAGLTALLVGLCGIARLRRAS